MLFNLIFIYPTLISLIPSIYCHDSILLSDITVLQFQYGKNTNGRRSAPVSQLNCLSGCENKIYSAMCKNIGSDGRDVIWKCEADLKNNLKFGITQVTCEGYNYPDDPYVLYGSCGLEYSIINTGRSNSDYDYDTNYDSNYDTNSNFDTNSNYDSYGNNNYNYKYNSTSAWKWISSMISTFFMVAVVSTILICMCCCRNDTQPQYGNYGGGGAPPPNNGPGFPGTDNTFGNPGFSTSSSSGGSNSGPGFFTGAGIGGLAGYMMGRNANYGYNQGGYNGYNQGGWGNWGNTGWGGGARNFGFGARPSGGYRAAPSRPATTSSTSSSYASTKRR